MFPRLTLRVIIFAPTLTAHLFNRQVLGPLSYIPQIISSVACKSELLPDLSFSAVGPKTDHCRVYSPYIHHLDLSGLAPARQILGAATLVDPRGVFELHQLPVCYIDWCNLQLLLMGFRCQLFPASAARVVLLLVHALYFLV